MKQNFKSQKEELIIGATNFIRDLFNIDESLWVFINRKDHFLNETHSALYDKKNFLIRYNSEWLKNADYENIIKTAFHEVFHVIQHDALENYKNDINNGVFTCNELEQMKIEFNDDYYKSQHNNWEELLIERQAEDFSNNVYDLLGNQNISIVEEMLKYTYKYTNNRD